MRRQVLGVFHLRLSDREFPHVLQRLPRFAAAMRALASPRLLGSNLGVALN
jgi:hypothetical protein